MHITTWFTADRASRSDTRPTSHVTNVASYGVIFAEHLKMFTGGELEQFAKAAILHDIGKRLFLRVFLRSPRNLTRRSAKSLSPPAARL